MAHANKQSLLLTLPSRPDFGHQQIVHDPYVTSLLTFQAIIIIQVRVSSAFGWNPATGVVCLVGIALPVASPLRAAPLGIFSPCIRHL